MTGDKSKTMQIRIRGLIQTNDGQDAVLRSINESFCDKREQRRWRRRYQKQRDEQEE